MKYTKTEHDELEELPIPQQLKIVDFKEDVIKIIIKLINNFPNDKELGTAIRKNFKNYFTGR